MGLEAVLVDQSDRGCSASVAVARLVASNRHYSAGNKSWVSLRNLRRADGKGISKWSGTMRRSQMAMTVAALRAVALDLGDGGEAQGVLLSIAEDLLEQAGILEAEMGDAALLARLAVLQARVAADTEAIFGPLDCGFETHVIAHTNYHVPENAPTTGGVIHWDSGRGIETKMSPLKAAFEHFTGVWDVDKTLAVHHDRRGFAEQRLNPALDAAAAGFKAAACPGGAAASSASAASACADSDSDSDAVSDDAGPRVVGAYTRFPDAPQLDVRCTGALWSDMRCSDSGSGAPQVGGRLLQALEVAYNWLRDDDANLPRYSLDVLYWRRALRICRPPSLLSEGCRRSLPVVPAGALGVDARDAKLYASRQPCLQMFKPSAAGGRVPDDTAMVRIEALVSVDMRKPGVATRLPSARVNGFETADLALIALLPHVPRHDSACFKGFSNRAPSLLAGPPLKNAELACFRLVDVSELCQPRWAFAAFGDEELPAGDGDIGPWDGPLVSVLMVPGS